MSALSCPQGQNTVHDYLKQKLFSIFLAQNNWYGLKFWALNLEQLCPIYHWGGTGFLPYKNVWTRADADTLVQVVSHTKKYFCCRENKRQIMTVHFSTEQKFA